MFKLSFMVTLKVKVNKLGSIVDTRLPEKDIEENIPLLQNPRQIIYCSSVVCILNPPSSVKQAWIRRRYGILRRASDTGAIPKRSRGNLDSNTIDLVRYECLVSVMDTGVWPALKY